MNFTVKIFYLAPVVFSHCTGWHIGVRFSQSGSFWFLVIFVHRNSHDAYVGRAAFCQMCHDLEWLNFPFYFFVTGIWIYVFFFIFLPYLKVSPEQPLRNFEAEVVICASSSLSIDRARDNVRSVLAMVCLKTWCWLFYFSSYVVTLVSTKVIVYVLWNISYYV